MARKDVQDPNSGEGKQASMEKDSTSARRSRTSAARGLDVKSQEAIGRSLTAHYDDLVRAPVPDKFLELLDRLDAKEQSPKSQDGHDE